MDSDNQSIDVRFRDSSLPVEERVEILLAQMTLEEKAGLFFHAMISMGEDGALSDGDEEFDLPSNAEYVSHRHMSHFNLLTGGSPEAMARWNNHIQDLARSTRLGIPVTVSTDPRNSYSDNPLAGLLAGAFSVWPEALGLAAIRDEGVVREFADIARQEYLAVGIRVALHPQIDLATEPRWARQLDTFGEDAELTSRLGVAYIQGFQGEALGRDSVATMAKHFPGGGPQKDGEDPHFAYGREQVYPGGRFDLHLAPFRAAIAAGASQMMPYYGMPVGTEYEEVGFGFNRSIITELLREKLGFDGIVCTDWGLINDATVEGEPFPARAWGVEDLTPRQRMRKAVDAGVDQFGGEACPEMLVELVEAGEISEARLDISARRLLAEKFVLGLFDDPYVDPAEASRVVGAPAFIAAGLAAQRASLTLLTNRSEGGRSTLPAAERRRLYVEGIPEDIAAGYGTVVADPLEADLALVRIHAPYEKRSTAFENYFHAGSLEMDDETVSHIAQLSASTTTVVDVFLDRPAILTPILESADAVVANYGAHPRAVLDVLFGRDEPRGRLPFDLPSSMAAVEASRSDVPFDTADPLLRYGHGLSYGAR
ncbi:glycoside hydrolase family 3 protein [Microbacterium oxydans]|uniref:glycoside hydrolase family 3 protein n=1 Tax=Microbacterium oxydans TaxID=82380 RepID=UPI000B808BCA|nr:glycoside hydrolase family 3 N-terminal domain-containing protein [Microbacterium oxydans]